MTGPTTLIEAAGHGKKCAYAIDRYLAGRTDVTVTPNVKITSSWRHDMPEFYDVLPRQHIPMVPLAGADAVDRSGGQLQHAGRARLRRRPARSPSRTRCLMCNYNIWFDPFRCVLCGACADVCPEGVIHMVDINQLKSEGLLPELEEAYGWDQGGGDDPRRGALHPLRAVRQAMPVRRHYDGAVRAAGDLDRRSALQGVVPGRAARRHARRRRRSPVSFLERVDQSHPPKRACGARSSASPYPRDERSRAYAVMNNVFLHIHPVRVRQHAVKFAYTFCLGGLSFFLFLVLTVTGVYLMFFYVPSATQAYTNILDIQSRGDVRAADPEHPPLGAPT